MESTPGRGSTRPLPTLPTSLTVLAFASLAQQVVSLLVLGPKDDGASYLISMAFGGLVVGWVAAGVTRARTVRLALAWLVLVIVSLALVVDLLTTQPDDTTLLDALTLAFTLVSLAALREFHRTDWFIWQRTLPSTEQGEPIGAVVAIGVLVGVLGGIIPVQHAADLSNGYDGSSYDDSHLWDDGADDGELE